MTRTARLYLTLAAALAASSLASARQAPPPPAPAAAASTVQAGRAGGPIRSPEIGAEGGVTFRYRAPGAEEVLVSVSGQRLPMQKDDEGVWSVTSEPLTPDIYTYAFVVDGASTTDPANRQVQTSFGSFQSLFMVPGPKPWLPAPNVPRGAIAKHTYHSAVAGDDRNFFVYTPADYNLLRTEAYPVLYLLHGLGDDAERWMEGGTADRLIGANRQFKDWLRTKGVAFTEQEVPDVGHVWPLWRENVADMLPRLFQPAGR